MSAPIAAASARATASSRGVRAYWPKHRRSRRRLLGKLAGAAFLAIVVVLLVRYARAIEWSDVGRALARYDTGQLVAAMFCSMASYFIYGSYDLIGRHYTKHRASLLSTMSVAMVGYAFNQNLGSMVGGVAARFRLYTRLGLAKLSIARIIALSVASNWLGHLASAGIVFAFRLVELPPDWPLGAAALQLIGVLLLAIVAAYVLLCAFSVRRHFTVKAHTLMLPSWRIALLQLTLAVLNWTAIAVMIDVLLDFRIPYATVLGVLLLASIAALITHIPAGLGAIEAVFLALLTPQLPRGDVIAALLAFRAVYYLLPLALAVVAYFVIEVRGRRLSCADGAEPHDDKNARAARVDDRG